MIVALLLAAISLLIFLSTYNSLMHLQHEVRTAWSHMDEELKRRYGLLPSLMNAVEKTGGEPANKLQRVTAARNQAAVAITPDQLASAEDALSVAVQQVVLDAAQNPALKGNDEFAAVCRRLSDSDRLIAQARQHYNSKVYLLNAALISFPTLLTAKALGFQPKPFFGNRG